jgi:cyanophycin synthetase
VPEAAIEVIPDEQAAIAAALQMARPGDLLLIFADALTRSWKQVIKFKPEGGAGPVAAADAADAAARAGAGRAMRRESEPEAAAAPVGDDTSLESQGFIRDERGLRFVGEAAD